MKKTVVALTTLCFLITGIVGTSPIYAQNFVLPTPGQIVTLSPAFSPAILKGIQLDANNPFRFHFFVDSGDDTSLRSPQGQNNLRLESERLIKYFLASLTIPENDLWVNLSPYEKNRIVPREFGQTEMGRDLLAEDYLLKQITASLIYPESQLGKKFWAKIYAQAQAKFGTTNISVNTFNKVWIVPEKAVVYENAGVAFVLENHLKVMLEQDYLSLAKHEGIQSGLAPTKETNQLGSQIVREIVIPALTKEVNEGKNFAQLRQVFYSLILATWYKKKIQNSILNKIYSNRRKLAGINISVEDKDKIYQEYLKAYKKGVFNYIKDEPNAMSGQAMPKKYFAGGVVFQVGQAVEFHDLAMMSSKDMAGLSNSLVMIDGGMSMVKNASAENLNFKNIEVERIWRYIQSEARNQDRLVGILKIILESIDKKVSERRIKIVYDFHMLTTQGIDYSVRKDPIRIGVVPLTANPLNLTHIAGAINFLDQENIGSLILLVQGNMKFKNIPDKDKAPEDVRHALVKQFTDQAAPLIPYSDVGKGNEDVGEFNMYKLLELNPNRTIEMTYLATSETKERVYNIVRNLIKGLRKYGLKKNHTIKLCMVPIGQYGPDQLTNEKLAQIIEEVSKQDQWQGPRMEGNVIKNIDYYFHSTDYRNGARDVVPVSIDKTAQQLGLFGYPSRDRAQLSKGGIDLNPAQMSMQIKKDGQDFKFNFNGSEIDAAQITGATFAIRTMTPVTNLSAVLGIIPSSQNHPLAVDAFVTSV